MAWGRTRDEESEIKKEKHATVVKEWKRCKNPMCFKLIYRDGYKYGTGIYCDMYCRAEGVHWSILEKKRKAKLFKGIDLA